MSILFGGKAGQAGRPAGPKFSSKTPQFSSKTDRFSTETAKFTKFLLGAATLPVRNITLSSPLLAAHRRLRPSIRDTAFLWWDHSTLLCSQHYIPLMGPQHSPLFATQHSSGGTTALSSVRDTAFLWWDHSTLLCSQHSIPLA